MTQPRTAGDLFRLEVPSGDDLAYRKWCELLEYGWGHVLLRKGKYRTIQETERDKIRTNVVVAAGLTAIDCLCVSSVSVRCVYDLHPLFMMGWLEVMILVCVANGNRYLVTIAALVAVVESLANGDDGVIVIIPFAAITLACIEW